MQREVFKGLRTVGSHRNVFVRAQVEVKTPPSRRDLHAGVGFRYSHVRSFAGQFTSVLPTIQRSG